MSAARGATDAFSGVSGSANHYVCLGSIFYFTLTLLSHFFFRLVFLLTSLYAFFIFQLRKYGAKDIKVGLGCGIGFGHGFGVGMLLEHMTLFIIVIEKLCFEVCSDSVVSLIVVIFIQVDICRMIV